MEMAKKLNHVFSKGDSSNRQFPLLMIPASFRGVSNVLSFVSYQPAAVDHEIMQIFFSEIFVVP